jgi:hypothetical protein
MKNNINTMILNMTTEQISTREKKALEVSVNLENQKRRNN